MMRNLVLSGCLAVAVIGGLALLPSAQADGRKAADILKELNVIAVPKGDATKPADKEKLAKRAELIGELYKADPLNPQLDTLLPARWKALVEEGAGQAATVHSESTEVLAKTKKASLKTEATYYKAASVLMLEKVDVATKLKDVEAFVKTASKDFRSPQLLLAASSSIEDAEKQKELLKQLIKEYPKSKLVAEAKDNLKNVGKKSGTFDLEFKDAIKGTEISMKSLKGKVVVVDFWATWCGPCVAEMPKMKKLYAEFKDQGVEFLGVSLDQSEKQGGLKALKDFCAKNEITWPQYYQGNFWDSEFSKSLGINSIPCVYIIDHNGKLVSTEARGKLETMIPQLLKKAGRPRAETGG